MESQHISTTTPKSNLMIVYKLFAKCRTNDPLKNVIYTTETFSLETNGDLPPVTLCTLILITTARAEGKKKSIL